MPTDSDDARDELLSPDEAFATLGNETRFATVRALADADGTLSFSALRDRVGMADSGQFNFDRLVGPFVERADEGYRLAPAGERVAEAVLSGVVTERPDLDGEPIDQRCEYCGGAVELDWKREGVGLYCTSCDGKFGQKQAAVGELASEDAERGYLGMLPVPPAGVRDRDPDEAYRTAWTWGNLEILSLSSDICPRCGAPVTFTPEVYDDHDANDGVCATCENRHRIRTSVACENCTFDSGGAFAIRLVGHTAVLDFLTDHGLNPVAPESPRLVNAVHEDYEEDLLSTDPFRARFAFRADDERLVLTVDDDLTVAAAEREPR